MAAAQSLVLLQPPWTTLQLKKPSYYHLRQPSSACFRLRTLVPVVNCSLTGAIDSGRRRDDIINKPMCFAGTKQNPFEHVAKCVINALRALTKPAAAAALLLGFLLLMHGGRNSALAAGSGGRMGGSYFSSSSSSSSRSSSASKPSSSSSASKPSSSHRAPKPSSSSSASKPSSSYREPKPSSSHSVPKPSWSHSVPKPSSSYKPPKPSLSHSAPKPSSSYSAPKPSSSYRAPKPSSSHSVSKPSSSYTAPKRSSSHSVPKPSSSYTAPKGSSSHSACGGSDSPSNAIPEEGEASNGALFVVVILALVVVWPSGSESSSVRRPVEETREATPIEKTSVMKLQVGLLGSARSLQKDLNQIAQTADTSSSEGLQYILTETALVLLRHRDYCISTYSSVDVNRSIEGGEQKFNELCIEERAKFDEETLVNVNNIKKQRPTRLRGSGSTNEYIVVTILVAARGEHELPSINNSKDLKEALQKLASIPLSGTLAVEVMWTPQNEDDTLSEIELLEDYPSLRPL